MISLEYSACENVINDHAYSTEHVNVVLTFDKNCFSNQAAQCFRTAASDRVLTFLVSAVGVFANLHVIVVILLTDIIK